MAMPIQPKAMAVPLAGEPKAELQMAVLTVAEPTAVPTAEELSAVVAMPRWRC